MTAQFVQEAVVAGAVVVLLWVAGIEVTTFFIALLILLNQLDERGGGTDE